MLSRAFCLSVVVCLLGLVLAPSPASANVWTVRQDGSGDFTTIGDAVTAAAPNDEINVGPGVYTETVYVQKTLTFVSENGSNLTMLDAGVLGQPFFLFEGGGTITASVKGFTFQNGNYWNNGGAVRVGGGAAVTFTGCLFNNNGSEYSGGAIFVRDYPSVVAVLDCVFAGNYAAWAGGAIAAVLGAEVRAFRCKFEQNTCGGQSASLQCNDGTMEVRNCLFLRNSSADLTGGIYYYQSSGLVENNTFFENSSPGQNGASLVVNDCISMTISKNIFSRELAGWGLRILYCLPSHTCNLYSECMRGPIAGGVLGPDEIEADPIFCSPASGNFAVDYQSPAAPLNSPCGQLIGAFEAGCGSVPVFVTSFDASAKNRWVDLVWDLYADEGIQGFKIYRRDGAAEQDVILNGGMQVPASERSFTDLGVNPGESYEYRLGVVLLDGSEVFSQTVTVTTPAALFALDQNVPNPFNPSTRIPFAVREPGHVRLQVFDAQGTLIRTVVDEFKPAGTYAAVWEGTNGNGNAVATGIYFARLESGGQTATRKMLLVK